MSTLDILIASSLKASIVRAISGRKKLHVLHPNAANKISYCRHCVRFFNTRFTLEDVILRGNLCMTCRNIAISFVAMEIVFGDKTAADFTPNVAKAAEEYIERKKMRLRGN